MKTRKINMKQLRRMIQEEANLLQGKDEPSDVSLDEMPWEEAEDVGKQDFIKQMDKSTPSVKAEQRLRTLKVHAGRLAARLKETKRRIAAYERVVVEGRRRSRRRRRR